MTMKALYTKMPYSKRMQADRQTATRFVDRRCVALDLL